MEQENKNKEQSAFFQIIMNAVEEAKQVTSGSDSCFMVVTDGMHCVSLVGGKEEDIHDAVIEFMKKNPVVAGIICGAAIDFHLMLMKQPVLKTPPVPEGGIPEEEWKKRGGNILFINKESEENKGS